VPTLNIVHFYPEIEVLTKPLVIPYVRDTTEGCSYMNLRETPEAIEQLPELRKRKPLYDFVKAINAPSSPFQTFGCETWQSPWSHEQLPGFVTRVGSYVDLTFVDTGLCRSQQALRNLVRSYQLYGQACVEHVAILVGFNLRLTTNLETDQWWTLEFWNYGVGRNDQEAEHWWAEGLRCFKTFLLDRRETQAELQSFLQDVPRENPPRTPE
jgi:hypothetical protein